jgi:16S rRNA (guanine966-N2)-methyltransferase
VRIIAGSAKGTRLASVPAGTRPVSDRAREGVFSSLGERVVGARVLDLYAGTGALGIEALSRGAAAALFVDSAPAAVKVVAENLRRARMGQKGTVRRQDVRRALTHKIGQFDLVFADPPYAATPGAVAALLAEIAGQGALAPGGTVVLTRARRNDTVVVPVHWRDERRLSYGDSVVLVLRAD